MITMSQPAGTSQSFITSTRPGETHDLGYHDPALVPRRPMRGRILRGPAPVPVPKVLPDAPIPRQKSQEPMAPEPRNGAFGKGAVEGKLGSAAAEAEGAVAEGGAAAEGAGLIGTIARLAPLAL